MATTIKFREFFISKKLGYNKVIPYFYRSFSVVLCKVNPSEDY